ncbi:hypothetical protein I553_1898 [Mycobacterium xenopi 4042]|uniref:MEDS domain-containing protein n=1 Tax=Mycobacterium xenopi 4042 TaxID=1299334 RepID=X8DMK4_MYCXE|nr:hypothetical protein I553_1898 [Mycobacterium xenopi 4042]
MGYRDESEFLARAAEYIADGLALNQRILYARDRSRAALHTELLEMGFGSAVRSRQISVTPVAEHYVFVAGTDVVDPEATVAAGVAAMEYVVAMGCSGCRAVVDGPCWRAHRSSAPRSAAWSISSTRKWRCCPSRRCAPTT